MNSQQPYYEFSRAHALAGLQKLKGMNGTVKIQSTTTPDGKTTKHKTDDKATNR